MKILQVIPFFSPSFGGSVTSPYHLSRWLAMRGHEVTVLTTDYQFDPGYADSLKNITVVPVHSPANLGLFIYSPGIAAWLKSNIKAFDLIHLHNFRSYQNNIVSKYAYLHHIPYIVQPHGSFPRIMQKERLKRLYDLLWGDDILKHAKKIVAVSHSEEAQFRDAGIPDWKIQIIPNGINLLSVSDRTHKGEFRERLGLQGKRIILFVGRIHKIKGIDFLIHAFNSFVKSRDADDVVLVIVGPDDGYRVVLENLIGELGLSCRVTLVDYLSTVGLAYQDADLLVYPSRYEIFGLVPLEALLYGTPVIVTNGCGCGEIVMEAGCGYLVRFGDVSGLSEMMGYVLNHPEENSRKVKNGQRYIEANLSWESVVKQMEDTYTACLQ